MAKEYFIAGPDGNRTSSDPGSATVMGGGKGSATPSNWAPWAYTAGGGVLGYLLSKWIMGDDEEENGKKKDKGLLSSLVPWLAAAAGAYGGHLLSGAGLTDKGGFGEFAFKKNKDGTVQVPDKPSSGKIANRTGNALIGTSALTAAKGVAEKIKHRPDVLSVKALQHSLSGDGKKARELFRTLNKIRGSRGTFASLHPRLARLGSFVGTPLGGEPATPVSRARAGNGTLYLALAQLLGGAAAKGVGYKMNSNLSNWHKALDMAGIPEPGKE